MPNALDVSLVRTVVAAALEEDGARGDVTTRALVPPGQQGRGVIVAKSDGVLCGLPIAQAAFVALDPSISFEPLVQDGASIASGDLLARVAGPLAPILSAERVALNFLQRLSGVATVTRRFVDAVAGTASRIRDTRKTTPLLRFLEKYAVEVGGGVPHRERLDTGVLVKDNHIRLAGSVRQATLRALAGAEGLPVEVEVESLEQLEEAIVAGAHMVLVDNFAPEEVRAAVAQARGRVPIEASGGVRLDNVRAFAEAGPDYIAIGALTHSAPAVDISMEIEV
jgi:nicotinate-nucleotide pyrophosphorylase (carboxylating)